eukprot:14904044-Alexandrium_andersonii.AAC.1
MQLPVVMDLMELRVGKAMGRIRLNPSPWIAPKRATRQVTRRRKRKKRMRNSGRWKIDPECGS